LRLWASGKIFFPEMRSDIPASVTIGVAIRFESPGNLEPFLRDLAAAARQLDKITESEVIFCLNGAKEATREFVAAQAAALNSFELPFVCIESPPGKIQAHLAVNGQRGFRGHMLFVDADVRFGPDTFRKLYECLQGHPEMQACSAEVKALPSIAGGWFGNLQNAYYQQRDKLPRRTHLHGRCFMLREWLNEFSPQKSHASQTTHDDQKLAHLALHKGPLVDDIHYSRVLVHHFGPQAIAQVPEADVQFVPPDSTGELYRDSFRTEFELARLAHLFPEHTLVEREVFARQSPWQRCVSAIRPAGLKASAYLALEVGMRAVARHRILYHGASPASWRASGQNHHAT
jgi:hypothetical protein